jgi:RND family efflux transporter MFP subunit
MRYFLSLIALVLIMTACQPEQQQDPNAIPTDLAGKKAFVKEKKAELRKLNQLITKVESEIEALIPDEQKAKKTVTLMPVTTKDFKRFIDIQASVQSDDMVSASSEVGGRIIQLTVKEGSPVRKGQLIAKVDLEQLDKQVAELETALQLATTVFEKRERLWKQNIGSELQYLEAKNNKERLEKSLETIAFQKTKANVYAPISGIVEKEFIKQGEVAAPSQPIVQILNTNKVKVIADVPETYLGKVKRGELLTIKFPAIDKEMQARVKQLGRVIDPANRTFEVEVEIANSNKILKPNLLASMMINDFSADNVVTIPLEMVQQEVSGKDYVFVKKDGQKGAMAQKVYIETGETYDGEVIIKEGLAGGENLIIKGARGLVDNQLIAVQNSK